VFDLLIGVEFRQVHVKESGEERERRLDVDVTFVRLVFRLGGRLRLADDGYNADEKAGLSGGLPWSAARDFTSVTYSRTPSSVGWLAKTASALAAANSRPRSDEPA